MRLLPTLLATLSLLISVLALDLNPPVPPGGFRKISGRSVIPRPRPRWLDTREPSAMRPREQELEKRGGHGGGKPSNVPTPVIKGYISVSGKHGSNLGFVAKTENGFGEYGFFTSQTSEALLLSFSPASPPSETGGLTALNGPLVPNWPLLASIVGYSSTSNNLGQWSYNYATLGGASIYGENSYSWTTGYASAYQTAGTWTIDPKTQKLTANWKNTNGKIINPTLFYASDQSGTTLGITGDFNAFSSVFTATEIIFTFVPL